MQVPEWLLILLSVSSIVLLIIAIFFLVSIIKNCLRRQKYEKVRPKGKYVPGKTIAYFKGNYEQNASIIPKTYPAVLNPGSTLVIPLTKAMSHSSSVSSTASDHRTLVAQYAASQSIDEHFPRRSIKTRSGLEMKRIRSPLLCKDENADDNVRRSGSFGAVSVKSEEIPIDIYNADANVYSHSDLLADVDNSECIDTVDNPYVVSYDQDNAAMERIFEPGSLCFELEYKSAIAELLIVVTRCLDLPPVKGDLSGTLNTYVNLCLVPEDFLWQRTQTVQNDRDPIYNENFQITDVLYHKLREYTLCFYIMDCNSVMGERVVGKVLYPLSDLRADNRIEVCKELSPP